VDLTRPGAATRCFPLTSHDHMAAASWDLRAQLAAAYTLADLAPVHAKQPRSSTSPSPRRRAPGSAQSHFSDDEGADVDPEGTTPVLARIARARDTGYDVVCLPLATGAWRARWRAMCVLDAGGAQGNDAKDSDVQDSEAQDNNRRREAKARAEAEARAEAWRANPHFETGETTMSRLGVCCLTACVGRTLIGMRGVDEALGTVVMVSDWLELDAADDWVRHDSEIVRVSIVLSCILSFTPPAPRPILFTPLPPDTIT
jgi:hypothetical protein